MLDCAIMVDVSMTIPSSLHPNMAANLAAGSLHRLSDLPAPPTHVHQQQPATHLTQHHRELKSASAQPAGQQAVHRRGPWSDAEDMTLRELVSSHGPSNWVLISSTLKSRSAKQCRERFHQNLKPSLNHTPITPEEGRLIEQLVAEIGKKWAEIARRLPGRSDNAVKNWWNGSQNRQRRQENRRHNHSRSPHDFASLPSRPHFHTYALPPPAIREGGHNHPASMPPHWEPRYRSWGESPEEAGDVRGSESGLYTTIPSRSGRLSNLPTPLPPMQSVADDNSRPRSHTLGLETFPPQRPPYFRHPTHDNGSPSSLRLPPLNTSLYQYETGSDVSMTTAPDTPVSREYTQRESRSASGYHYREGSLGAASSYGAQKHSATLHGDWYDREEHSYHHHARDPEDKGLRSYSRDRESSYGSTSRPTSSHDYRVRERSPVASSRNLSSSESGRSYYRDRDERDDYDSSLPHSAFRGRPPASPPAGRDREERPPHRRNVSSSSWVSAPMSQLHSEVATPNSTLASISTEARTRGQDDNEYTSAESSRGGSMVQEVRDQRMTLSSVLA